MDGRVGPKRSLSTQELMLFNCAVWKGSWQSLVLQGDPTSPNQSIRDKTSSEHSLERLMVALKLQHFGHRIQRADSLEKTLMLGKVKVGIRKKWNDRGWDGWMASLTPWTWAEQALGDGEGQGSLVCCGSWGHVESDTTERLNNNRGKWRGHQQQFRILEQRTERARDRGSGKVRLWEHQWRFKRSRH